MINLENKIAHVYNINTLRIIEIKSKVDDQVSKMYDKSWNKDNFGPLIIPKNRFFSLRDNRDNSMDSRVTGLQDVFDIIGVVVGK